LAGSRLYEVRKNHTVTRLRYEGLQFGEVVIDSSRLALAADF
jgi:hypothetical protein